MFFFLILSVQAQNTLSPQSFIPNSSSSVYCANEVVPFVPNQIDESMDHCFDVEQIMEDCTTVWVRVNIHYFLDDNCEGGIEPRLDTPEMSYDYVDPSLGYQYAEEIVNGANDMLDVIDANETTQINVEPRPEYQCIPIRFLLDGVYFHCDSDISDQEIPLIDVTQIDTEYQENDGSAINIYLFELINDFNGVGLSNAACATTDMLPTTWGFEGNFIHELGHVFSLGHTHDFDGLSDTPEIEVSYDFNCDGDFTDDDDYNNSPCWDNGPIATSADWDNDGIDENMCIDTSTCAGPHPCCEWENQSNNVMTYSSWGYTPIYSTITPQQVEQMLNHLATAKCDYIVDVTSDCPPPNAFIDIQPEAVISQGACSFCISLEASMHDTEYLLDFYTEDGDLLNTTGWIEGPANSYCITTTSTKPSYSWPGGFEPNSEYTAVLTVENECGDADSMTIGFITPEEGCYEPQDPREPITITNLSPNPTRDYIQIEYEKREDGNSKIYASHIAASAPILLIENELEEGLFNATINTNNWQAGTYYLFVVHEGSIYNTSHHLVKQNY